MYKFTLYRRVSSFFRWAVMCFLLAFILNIQQIYAQTYANSQENGVNGLCALCGVINPENAVNANLNDYSEFQITAGLLGVSVYQTLIFPEATTSNGCDSLVIGIGSSNALIDLNLFGGVTAETFNGAVSNGDATVLSSSVLRLIDGNTRAEVVLKPTANFDRVTLTLSSSLVGLLNGFRIYYAYYKSAAPLAPSVSSSNVQICSGQTASLLATGPAGATFNWFTTPSGGSSVFTGANFITPALVANTTYYVESSVGTCTSTSRTAVNVTVNPAPAAPTVASSNVQICSGQTASLTATGPVGATFNWFTTSSGGSSVFTGANFITPALVANTTYYVESSVGTCTSTTRTAVNVTVNPAPAAPSVASSNVQICSGQTASLTATGPAGATFNWYTTASGGSSVFTGANFITPALVANTTYYVESSVGTCTSTTRTAVNVTVNPAPAAPTVASSNVQICSGQTASLTATGPAGATFNWFTTPSGGSSVFTGANFITPALVANTTYYVESSVGTCTSTSRTAVNVTVSPAVLAPTVASSTVNICSGQTASLQAVAPIGATFNWYTVPSGGVSVFTGANYTTPPLVANTIYYVESTVGTCSSTIRTPVSVIVTPLPVAPTVASSDVQICSGQAATLSAIAPVGASFNWYTVASGGVPIFTGASYTTPVLVSNATYFVESSAGTCSSSTRTAVNVTVNPAPAAPSVGSSSVTICSGQTATLSAIAPIGATYNWYTVPSGGVSVFTGPSYVTPALFANSTYYVESTVGTCSSTARTAVNVIVNSIPSAPTVASSNVQICSGQTATLTAIAPAGAVFNWYTVASGGAPIFTGASYTTPILLANAAFYVEASVGTCASATRTVVNVTVNSVPVPPTVALSNVTICSGETATLSAIAPIGATFNWYTVPSGGVSVFTGPNYITPVLFANTVYYVESVAGPCSSSSRTSVSVTVTPAVLAPTVASSTVNICSGQTASLLATAPVGATFNWFTVPSGGSSIFTGANFITPVLFANTTYYVQSTVGSCSSTTRTAVTVQVTSTPASPTVVPASTTICSGQSASLAATAPLGAIFNWYTVPTGGVSVFTGSNFNTPVLAANTTYYVEASSGTCVSASRTAVNVIVQNCQNVVSSFTLVNATTNADIATLNNGDILDIATLPSEINIRANVENSSITQSVVFTFSAHPGGRTENDEPYSLFTDNSGNYNPWCCVNPGTYQLSAKPYTGNNASGSAGTVNSITFYIIDSRIPAILSYTLVNADTDSDIGPLVNGQTLSLANLPARLNIRANANGVTKSVYFNFSNNAYDRIENEVPFSLFTDINGNYNAWCCPSPGTYSLTTTPYYELNATGTAGASNSITFYITNTLRISDIDAYPNPMEDNVTISVKGESSEISQVIITDLNGKEYYSGAIKIDSTKEIDLSELNMPTGIYILKAISGDEIKIKKIIKR